MTATATDTAATDTAATDTAARPRAGVVAGEAGSSEAAGDPPWLAPPAPAPPVALYVHVPFCRSICPYCDFVVLAGSEARGPRSRIGRYLAALHVEVIRRARSLEARWGPPGTARRPALASLYLGGGTPSLLPVDAVADLVAVVRDRYGLLPDAEVTIEANPGPDERGDAAALRQAGITRLSYGAQSLDPAALRRLGRRHRPEDVAAAVDEAVKSGIESVNLDLLLDIPGQSLERWAASLETALGLGPDHLSVYALTLDDPDGEGITGPLGDHLPLRAGARRWRHAARADQDEDRAADAYRWVDRRLADVGYTGYEISNWARPGAESRHNLAYWTGRSWEAVGVGAHAFDGRTRRWNAASLAGYLEALEAPVPAPDVAPTDGPAEAPHPGRGLPPGGATVLDARTAIADRLILGLRLRRGVPAWLATEPPLRTVAPWALEQGLLEPIGDRLRLTLRGRLLSNEVFARLV